MEAISLTAAVAQLVQMGVQGIRALRKAVPEYGKFWDDFERQLKNEHDVPWDTISVLFESKRDHRLRGASKGASNS